MGCGLSSDNNNHTDSRRRSEAQKEVIENYNSKRKLSNPKSVEPKCSVTQNVIRNSKPGSKGLLSAATVEQTASQVDFFKMLDEKVYGPDGRRTSWLSEDL